MRAIKYRELKRLYDSLGARAMEQHLTEAMESKDSPLKPEDFSLRELGVVFFGEDRLRDAMAGLCLLTEEGDGVDHTAFSNITGRIVSAKVLERYNSETNALSALISTEPNIRIEKERMPGLQDLGEVEKPVLPAMSYPRAGFGERYQDMPEGQKYGLIVPVTKEAVFFDRTGQILAHAGRVGEVLGYRKEKEIAETLLGINNNYNYGGVAYNTYQNLAAGSPWINVHGQPLENWENINRAERLWDTMTDPHTGKPIVIDGATLLCMPAKMATARMILTAIQIRQTNGAQETVTGNPIDGYTLGPKSRLLRSVANASGDFGDPDGIWLLGDFKRAFTYRENWPIMVLRAPTNAQDEFDRDIVAQYKATERGVCAVQDPRYVLISSGSCGHSSSGETLCDPDDWPAIDAHGGDAVR